MPHLYLSASLAVVVTSSLVSLVAASALTDLIAVKETALNVLAATGESAHSSRCSLLTQCNANQADQCSVPACGSEFPSSRGFSCNASFGVDTAMCGSACNGLTRSMTTPVVRVPPGGSFADSEMQAFVCSSRRLDATFNSNLNTHKLTAWQYMGHVTGSIRIYPGAPQSRDSSTCGSYDARLRPWFISASSGPKDLVIVIDRSGSMGNQNNAVTGETRMDAVKTAVQALLDTLTPADFVSVVVFDDTAEALAGATASTGLLRADVANINALKQAVSLVTPKFGTEFVPAFIAAFARFNANTELSSGCTRMILFLTDGLAEEDQSAILSTIASRQNTLGSRRATIFTYSMSSGASDAIPQAIACANNGVWARISDGQDPLTEMSQYYQFQASGITSTTVRWTNPYVDAFGLGEMVTGARAVYDRSKSVPLLIGVVGTDITMAELRQHADATQVINELTARSGSCPNVTLSTCQLQHLREATGYTCPGQTSIATCNSQSEIVTVSRCTAISSLNNILCSPLSSSTRLATSGSKSTSDVTCCASCGDADAGGGASSTVVIVVVIVVVVVAVAVIIGIVVFKSSAAAAAAPPDAAPAQAGPQAPGQGPTLGDVAQGPAPPVAQQGPAPPYDGGYGGYPQQNNGYPQQNNGYPQYPQNNGYPQPAGPPGRV